MRPVAASAVKPPAVLMALRTVASGQNVIAPGVLTSPVTKMRAAWVTKTVSLGPVSYTHLTLPTNREV